MKNILLYSDLHINKSSLKECKTILEELILLVNKYNVDTIISLGDNFDILKPGSLELDLFAWFIKELGNKKIIILAANSHESTTEEESILNHYGILSDNVKIVKEFKDDTHLYCGHYSLKESSKNYDAKISKEDLKKFLYVFLGHIHSYELIKPNVVHLGSSRYVNFDEAKDKQKIIALISNYGAEEEKVHFLKLKSPIPMIELELGEKDLKNPSKEAISGMIIDKNKDMGQSPETGKSMVSEGENPLNLSQIDLLCQKLDKLDKRTKVKVKILDFKSFQAFLPLVNKYSTKFEVFKYDTEFNVVSDNIQKGLLNETKNFKESFQAWIEQQKIDEKIKDILLKEIE